MDMKLVALSIIWANAICVSCLPSINDGKLIFTTVLYRHGDRTPIDPYPKDPYGNPKYWTTGWGQLTNFGKQHHYELGKWLRNRYSTLLNATYSKNEIYVRSTDVDRTLMSALSNLAGLYEPVGADVWNPDMRWQPIPVHTTPEKMDEILSAKKPCPAYDYAMKKLQESEEFQTLDQSLRPMYEYVTAHTGRKINSLIGAQSLYSNLLIESLKNFTLPDWTKKVFPDPLSTVSARAFQMSTYTPELARLKAGPLLKYILEGFSNKALGKSKPTQKMWMLSAHDITVANLLNTLGLFELHNPPFRSCVLMELRQVDGKPYVSIFYKNSSAEPAPLFIPQCGTMCPLGDMFDLYKPVLPEDWAQECQLSMLQMTYVDVGVQSSFGVFTMTLIIMISMIVLIAILLFYRRRSFTDEKWYYRIDG